MSRSRPNEPLVASLRSRGRLTLPKSVRDRLSLAAGDRLLILVSGDRVEVIPASVLTRHQLWSLSGRVRDGIESAERDVSAGRSLIVQHPRTIVSTLEKLARDFDGQ